MGRSLMKPTVSDTTICRPEGSHRRRSTVSSVSNSRSSPSSTAPSVNAACTAPRTSVHCPALDELAGTVRILKPVSGAVTEAHHETRLAGIGVAQDGDRRLAGPLPLCSLDHARPPHLCHAQAEISARLTGPPVMPKLI